MKRFALAAAAALAAVVATVGTLDAQQAGIKRMILQRADLAAPGREGIMGYAEIAPGAAAGRHYHHGEEMGYVIEGTSVLEVDGKAPVVLKPGDTYSIAAGTVHDAKNTGGTPAKVLAVYIVEKGKPLAVPVQ
jgi:quercetin dioxygenase-like cupin family protein